MIFDTIPGRIAALTLALQFAACAHRGASASTPRGSLAVATIGFGPHSGLSLKEQAECGLGQDFFEELHDEVGQSFALSGVVDPSGVAGLVLSMRFLRVEGQTVMSGTKRIVLEGQLVKDGHVTADFVAMRYSTKMVDSYRVGFKTSSCSVLGGVVEELAEDVGEWLLRPTMNAKLGDMK